MINIDKKISEKSTYSSFNHEEQKLFREWLHGLLITNVVELTFLKKDGSVRNMKATLNPNSVAAVSGTSKKQNDEVIVVTDTEINEWRSIRYDSIKEIRFNME